MAKLTLAIFITCLIISPTAFAACPSADLSGDCKVNHDDFAIIAAGWLTTYDATDLADMASEWLDGIYPTSFYLDNFDDNIMGSIWTMMASNESNFWLDETSQRLEIRAVPESNDDFALYVPNGWYLDTSQDFGFKIRYHNELDSETWSELLFALGDPSDVEDNHLQFSVCSLDVAWGYSGPYFYYELVQNSSQIDELYIPRASNDGWIFTSYDAVLDEVYFGINGYGPANAVKTVSGLLQGDWSGKQIGPHIGGSSENVEVLSGQAYWDDFIVDYGEIITE